MSDPHVVQAFEALLGPAGVLSEPDDRQRFEEGWRYGRGRAVAVLRPASTGEVSAAMALATRLGVRILPQGANTGLVGASTPDDSGAMAVLSLERMSRRIEVDPVGRTAVVDAGVLLSQLNEELEPHGLFFGVDLGADPRIGGMVATNTGGTRLLRYGDVRRNLLGLEVVLADGTVIERLGRLRKDNTGLDVKQLFCGTFGSFGVVTRASLNLEPLPSQRAVALVAMSDADAVLRLLLALERRVGGLLSAFEVVSAGGLTPVFEHMPRLRDPYAGGPPSTFTVLVELDTTLARSGFDLDELLVATLGELMEGELEGAIDDAFLGDGEGFWAIRHGVAEANRAVGRLMGMDISLPRGELPAFRAEMVAWLAEHHPFFTLRDFGHWGDGGVHFNVTWDEATAPGDAAERAAAVQAHVYATVVGRGGSYSAEHGVGPHNQACYDRFTAAGVRRITAALKALLDPDGLLGRVTL
jgi:FAD/FMN-containing dehydrogenase